MNSNVDTTKTITHVSLCAGYGGIDLGLGRAIPNLRTIAFSEIEAFACANLVSKMEAGLLDAAPIWTDLKTFPWSDFRDRVDILSGGYPCQPFSAAGNRLGKEDPRHLWPWIADGIVSMRPRVVFFENVEGHISLGLREVIEDLERIGYEATWGIFSASEVGAPHQRKRVFILAHRICEGLERYTWNGDHWSEPGWVGTKARRYVGASSVWRRVSFAADCDGYDEETGELGDTCSICGLDYCDECDCPGPTQDGYEYIEQSGVFYARPKQNPVWPSRPNEPQYNWEPPRVVGNAESQQGSPRDYRDQQGSFSQQEQIESGGGDCGTLRESYRQAQPALGGDSDGSTDWMDYAELCHACDNRTDELRLLGNGVVPATAERAFLTLINQLINEKP